MLELYYRCENTYVPPRSYADFHSYALLMQ